MIKNRKISRPMKIKNLSRIREGLSKSWNLLKRIPMQITRGKITIKNKKLQIIIINHFKRFKINDYLMQVVGIDKISWGRPENHI